MGGRVAEPTQTPNGTLVAANGPRKSWLARKMVLKGPVQVPLGVHVKKCKIWKGSCTEDGYGLVRYLGQVVLVHRLAYCKSRDMGLAEIAGLVIRHTCDNPPCFEEEHLILGTHAENVADRMERNRSRNVRGVEVGSAKLLEEDVLEVRRRLRAGEKMTEIAKLFGVTPHPIRMIKVGRTWRHL